MAISEITVKITRQPRAELPAYMTAQAAGMDVRALLEEPVWLPAGGRLLVPTGIAVAVPPGYELQVRPRSGLAIRHGVTLANSPGTIDADYRGEIKLILINHGREDFLLRPGDRLAQLVLAPVARCRWQEVAGLEESGRGAGGFGHTGRR
jgi:dUTP pyrophosphatase